MSALSLAISLAVSVAMLVVVPPVAAQSSMPSSSSAVKRDPLDAKAPAPPLAYRSAFSDYKPMGEDKVGWRQANDEVGRIGGWRVYAREANEPDAPSRQASPAAKPQAPEGSKPMPGGHSGHSMK